MLRIGAGGGFADDRIEPALALAESGAVDVLGAAPVAETIATGADVVLTGRVADPALSLAPAMHRFGWSEHDLGRLAGGTVMGHLLACSTQVAGGCFADPSRPEKHAPTSPISATRSLRSAPTAASSSPSSPAAAAASTAAPAPSLMPRVYDLAHARAGDKGNTSNVAVFACDAAWTVLERHLTAEVVANAYAAVASGPPPAASCRGCTRSTSSSRPPSAASRARSRSTRTARASAR